MTKLLAKRSSIPDLDGESKQSKVYISIICSVQKDIVIFNFIDVLLRKSKDNSLLSFI